jgi:cytochrome b subunit of formate dehydrogenase/nitrate/TMAO reductase-like tetraheme cytochrome c subunit
MTMHTKRTPAAGGPPIGSGLACARNGRRPRRSGRPCRLGQLAALALAALLAHAAEPAPEPATAATTDAATATETIANQDCLDCHLDANQVRTRNGKSEPMAVFPTNTFRASVHARLNCVDCHVGIKEMIHESKLPLPQCTTCHEPKVTHLDAGTNYAASIHGMSQKLGASAAATCQDCHGSHDIVPARHADSPVFKLNLPRTCAKCHSNAGLNKEYQMRYPEVAQEYKDSIHGRALLKMGLIVAPSCNDCHGVHDIKRSVDRSSPINRANVARTCGKCHVTVERIYNQSVHGKLLSQGDKNGPVCTDCHTAHGIEPPVNGHFKMASDRRCGKCHEDRLTHYRDTYHGKAMALGKPNEASDVAACYDCHGHHDVLPPSDPASRLSRSNIVQTCRQCHPKANAGFAGYQPHANPLDGKNYPQLHGTFLFMTALLIGVFAFFGGHTLLWLLRSVYLFFHDSKKFREAKIHIERDDELYTRFRPFERFLHFLVVTSFLLLVLTGMPLKFYYTDWAKVLFSILGGAPVARMLHRFGALITFLYFALHLAQLLINAWRDRAKLRDPATGRLQLRRILAALFGPDSMIPTLQDWRDFVAHNRWFFGRGVKPQFDRWTYWEKFDYFAVFWGVFAIGLSGLVMWFPEEFTLLLPGWVINIALVVHSDEALLAAGFIFTIHFFNTHFRLEKFPMDTVIFSGRIAKSELLHERKRWYDRLQAEGRLDDFRTRDEWHQWKGIARSFGYLFFGLGLVLLLLIIYAMASRLAH